MSSAHQTLGERESGTARLEEAVAAHRAALGDDADQSRRCAHDARRTGERHGAARGGGGGLPRGSDLTRPNVEVKVQEDFKDQGRGTLDALDAYIADCDAVVHLAGDMTGFAPGDPALRPLCAKYPDLADKLPPLGEALRRGAGVSYTQWEAWLALYHGKLLFIAKAAETQWAAYFAEQLDKAQAIRDRLKGQ